MRPRLPCNVQWNLCYQMTVNMSILAENKKKMPEIWYKVHSEWAWLWSPYCQKFDVVGGKSNEYISCWYLWNIHNFFPLSLSLSLFPPSYLFFITCNRRNGFDCAEVLTVRYRTHKHHIWDVAVNSELEENSHEVQIHFKIIFTIFFSPSSWIDDDLHVEMWKKIWCDEFCAVVELIKITEESIIFRLDSKYFFFLYLTDSFFHPLGVDIT